MEGWQERRRLKRIEILWGLALKADDDSVNEKGDVKNNKSEAVISLYLSSLHAACRRYPAVRLQSCCTRVLGLGDMNSQS